MKTAPVQEIAEEPPSNDLGISDAEDDEPPGMTVTRQLFASVSPEDWHDWRWQFKNRITSVEELNEYLPLSGKQQAQLRLVSLKYPFAITPYYLSLIDPADLTDPVRAQAIPMAEELTMAGEGLEDPLAEQEHSVVPGLVHRYPDRVLMVLTDICPMLCRHCTRKREWRTGVWTRSRAEIQAMLDYIRRHLEVRDVIISGGDPLTLSTARLEMVLAELRKIKHVEIVRIGTRCPVVLPQRIDDELCHMLGKYGPIWLNTHFNHPHEITPEAIRACDKLLRAGVPINNQAVLLKGVNDDLETQRVLCHGLLRAKVRPYYLFQCDDVQGTEHFWTSVEKGIQIIEGLRGFTSGLAVPTYVIDLPCGGGKIPIGPNYVLGHEGGDLLVRNYQGHLMHYKNPGAARTICKKQVPA
ncbi:MAG: KamA family radical SAM protein [Dehalococcoidia bacterium]|nr:KamA family radical SAM protein [Dehalococcoidia bacterium]